MPSSKSDGDPREWRLDISADHLDLYSKLSEHPRPLSKREAEMMMELIEAWRANEHRKHIALMHAIEDAETKSKREGSNWYGVRCVFRATDKDAYEERVTIWRAESLERAIELAEAEAADYGEATEFRYVGLAQGYHFGTGSAGSGSEVFSLIRSSSLGATDYLDRFFDTGSEMQAAK